MEVTFNSYTTKDDFLIMLTPTIGFSKDSGIWSFGFAWLCFVINIEF